MPKKAQIDKFKEAAKAAEVDESEEAFNAAVKKVASAQSAPKQDKPKPR